MPDQPGETTLSQWRGKTLTGWEEICQALVVMDSLPEEKTLKDPKRRSSGMRI